MAEDGARPLDGEADFPAIWERVRPYTMTGPARGLALYRAVRYVVARGVPGAFVECGVWRGGSAMLIALTLRGLGVDDRMLVLFDTFAGMTEPSPADVDLRGARAADLLAAAAPERAQAAIWAEAGAAEVRANLGTTGYPMSRVRLVEGDVRATLPRTATGPIALLRLDTDFHDSTKAELEALYPRLLQHGVLIVDDYGHWQGCRKAVDEYFAQGTLPDRRPLLLQEIDYTGRIAVRSEPNARRAPRYDWRPAGLADPGLIRAFPTLVRRDPAEVKWPYLRAEAPHVWRVDARAGPPPTGVVSLEEALLLHAAARPLAGRRGIEIGCHFGWSTAHLAAAGLALDVVDPALGNARQRAAVEESLTEAGVYERVRLWPGYSPGMLGALDGAPFGLAFVDGFHEQGAPLADVRALLPRLDGTAVVLFHDLLVPDVQAALNFLKLQGFRTRIWNTMQVMAIAWRGDYTPPPHAADERMPPAPAELVAAHAD